MLTEWPQELFWIKPRKQRLDPLDRVAGGGLFWWIPTGSLERLCPINLQIYQSINENLVIYNYSWHQPDMKLSNIQPAA
jgi:hypothetical protein